MEEDRLEAITTLSNLRYEVQPKGEAVTLIAPDSGTLDDAVGDVKVALAFFGLAKDGFTLEGSRLTLSAQAVAALKAQDVAISASFQKRIERPLGRTQSSIHTK